MDFISDAQMQELEAQQSKDFISDEEMKSLEAPKDFISDEDMKKMQAAPSLVDQIPGLVPQVIPKEEKPTSIMDVGNAILESGAHVATGLVGGGFGGPVGALNYLAGNAITGKPITREGFEEEFFKGMESLTYEPKTEAGKKAVKNYVAPVMENLLPAMGLPGEMGALHAGMSARKNMIKGVTPKEVPVREPLNLASEEFKSEFGKISEGEQRLLKSAFNTLDRYLVESYVRIKEIETEMGRTGIASEALVDEYEYLSAKVNKMATDRAQLEFDALGKTVSENELAIRAKEIQESLTKDVNKIRTEADIALNPPPKDTYKVSPHEIAIEKIEEARKMSKEQLADRILEAEEKLDLLKDRRGDMPGEEYSAMWDALNREIDAYEAIQRGETPDLSWAKPVEEVVELKPIEDITKPIKVEEPVKAEILNKEVPTGEEVANLLRGKQKMRDVLDTIYEAGLGTKGQRKLLEILRRIEHINIADFKFGTAIERNGKFSRGLYDPNTHTIELHKDGNIKTILHESVHAATHALLADGKSVAAKRMQALFDQFSLQTKNKTAYGFTDVHEFVAEAMTNSNFQKILASMESKNTLGIKVKKMWTEFKDIIREGLGLEKLDRRVLDDVLDSGWDLLEQSRTLKEEGFVKLSERIGKQVATPELPEVPTAKEARSWISRKFFGINALEGFNRDNPAIQRVNRVIRNAGEASSRVANELWYGKVNVNDMGIFQTLSKVKNPDSAYLAVKNTSNADMAILHDLFKKGFEEKLEYADNLAKNGQHLSPELTKTYNTLTNMFSKMETAVQSTQSVLGKKHMLPHRAGWYPAARQGQYSVEIMYRGNRIHVESFKTKQAADIFRARLNDGKNFKYMEVSDVLDAKDPKTMNVNEQFVNSLRDVLGRKFGDTVVEAEVERILTKFGERGGKLGHHHEHRTNVSGYKGSELFSSADRLGGSFKEGIQHSVNDFTSNLRSMIIKSDLANEMSGKVVDPVIQQMYDSALGIHDDFFNIDKVGSKAADVLDKSINAVVMKTMGKVFEAKEMTAAGHVMDTAMHVFYAGKMMAKPVFALAQILTTPYIIPELARDGHMLRAFYSTGKGLTKMLTGNKELWNRIKEDSQLYNTIEPQFRESLNLEKTTGKISTAKKILQAIEDYPLLGRAGTFLDGLSRVVSYGIALEHYKDLGYNSFEAGRLARQATDKAMNVYSSESTAPIFNELGFVGRGMKPLTSFSQNQLGNFISYLKEAKKGNAGSLISYGLITTALGGIISLPFIQEYERFRKIAEEYFDISIPSITEIISKDNTFLDRLDLSDKQVVQDSINYGVMSGVSGIDLASSLRTNETLFSVAGAIAMGQEDASRLVPILGGTIDIAKQTPNMLKTITGNATAAESRKAIDTLVLGPIGYGMKELAGANTTRSFGEQTNMMPTGKEAEADMPRTKTDITAGLLGTKSLAQKKQDQQMFELMSKDRKQRERIDTAMQKFVDSGDNKYLDKLIELGVDAKQIESMAMSGAFRKNVGQVERYLANRQGKVNEQKAVNFFNFGK